LNFVSSYQPTKNEKTKKKQKIKSNQIKSTKSKGGRKERKKWRKKEDQKDRRSLPRKTKNTKRKKKKKTALHPNQHRFSKHSITSNTSSLSCSFLLSSLSVFFRQDHQLSFGPERREK
jgi:hypothetical protein